jgi:hypothetical protein
MNQRDELFQRATGELCRLRAQQARERGEKEFHIGDLDTPEYRWFFEAGLDAAMLVVEEKLARVPA